MPNNAYSVDVEGLRQDKARMEKTLKSYNGYAEYIESGIAHMQNGLDSKTLNKYDKDMKSVLKKTNMLREQLELAIQIIDECIEKNISVDAYLKKKVEDNVDALSAGEGRFSSNPI